ncbi:MAG: CotH kinase family protein [Bacteroidaceae bacterium]|nr:CotH kinase family protein [Bacteroidaceae bacterium]
MNNMMFRRLSCLLLSLTASAVLYAFDGSVDHQLAGTMIYSGNESNAAKAFDDDASTYYSTSTETFGWVGLDLGEPYVITRVGFTPAPGSQGAQRMVLSLFEGANSPDFMDAVPLYLISSNPGRGTYTTADVDVSRGFRYVRFVGSAGSYANIAEMKVFGHAGEGDDSRFYQITNLPTLSVHVKNNILPTVRGEDFESQSLLIYEGGTMIQDYPILFRVRGNYSSTHENKAFRMKYNDGKSHHMMNGAANEAPAKAKKWVLINSYRDKTLMRNPVAWAMSRRGEKDWTPWSQVVDLVVNGCYWGTYTLADAVSVDRNRIDITEMTEYDTEDEFLTGGYFVEVDNNASREPYWFNSNHGNPITVHDPDEDIIQPVQFNYIRNTWNQMEDIVFGADFADKETGFRSVLDIETFCRHFLISEFNGNTDMLCQVFYYKERGDDHFYTGPVWDADLALENDQTTYPANQRMDWTYKVRDTGNWTQFVGRVLSDPTCFAYLQEMWAKLRKKGNFEPDDVAADVDSLRSEVRASANLNFIRWPYLNQWLSLNPEVPGSWEAEVDRVRNFVHDRVAWMDQMLSYGTIRQVNGVYQIASGLDLCNLSQMVNEGGETDAKAVLIADIDMADYQEDFQPIGTLKSPFSGTLDGKGHTISNLHVSGTEGVGLIGYPGSCTLSNIVFDETCSAEGTQYVGMLAGYARNGVVNISGIENHGTVTATDGPAAALVGYGRVLSVINVNNCSNTGHITAPYNAAAFVGPSAGKVTATNSYNIGVITGATEGKELAFAEKSTVVDNCWDYTSTQGRNMTPSQVDNGYLCYQLNYNAGGDKWRQNLDNGRQHDAYPVLRKNAGMVYEKEGRYSNILGESTKYRYYNLVITRLQGGSSGALQFAEFDILDDALNEVGALSVYAGPNGYNETEGWQSAADNNVDTKYCGYFESSASFLFDAGSEVDAFGYRIYTANDTGTFPERNPSSWKLYGSNTQLYDSNDAGWVLIDEQTDDMTLQATNFEPYDFYIPHALTSLTVSQKSAMLEPGGELQLQATYAPAAIQNVKFQWTSTNEEVATVDEQGLVVATGLGKTDIILSVPNVSTLRDTCHVTVVEEIPGHRYYQLAIYSIVDGSTIQFSEFDLLDKDGNEVKPLVLYANTGTYIKDHDAGDLFDDDVNTKYCAAFDPANTLYIYIDAGQRVTLSGYRITTAKDTETYPGRNPKTWSLFGSNTQSEVPDQDCWTLLDHREDDTTLGAANLTPYDFFFTYPQPVTPGDVNNDGQVDMLDYEMLRRYIVGRTAEGFVPEAADLNADGKVNAQDLVLLAKMINN